jgi:hypothetical protein
LRDAGQDVRRQITPANRLQVLDEIYFVRQMEEQYLDGEIGTCHPIPTQDPSSSSTNPLCAFVITDASTLIQVTQHIYQKQSSKMAMNYHPVHMQHQ